MADTNKPRGVAAEHFLIVALFLVALLARLVPGERTIDDAYITFRYARNLVNGAGFVYNPSERVLGTTTPLYALLMAALALLTGSRNFPAMALPVNALTGALSVGLLYLLGRRIAGHWAPASVAAALWAVAPYSVSFAVGGMETDLTLALLLGTAYAHTSGRSYIMAALSGLALLARPDTAILLGLLWLDQLLSWRKIPWREGLISMAVVMPWLIFGVCYFGSPVPNSIAAKSIAYRLPPEANLVRLLQHYATPFFEHRALPPTAVFVVFALYCALCILGGLNAIRRDRRSWPLIAYPFAYYAVFALANPLLFRWYLSPPLPFYILFILTGTWTVAHDLGRVFSRLWREDGNWGLPALVFGLFAAAALGLTLNAWDLQPDHGPERPAPEMAWFELELLYDRAADVVLAHASPGDTLSAGDIGVLGYKTDLHILDTVGLVTPEVAEYYPADPSLYVINYAIPADLVLALDPDYVVILEVYGRIGLLPDLDFQARYRLLEKIETGIYGSDGMLIFGRG